MIYGVSLVETHFEPVSMWRCDDRPGNSRSFERTIGGGLMVDPPVYRA